MKIARLALDVTSEMATLGKRCVLKSGHLGKKFLQSESSNEASNLGTFHSLT